MFLSLLAGVACRWKIGNQGDWGILTNKQNRIRCTPMHCLPIYEQLNFQFVIKKGLSKDDNYRI